MVDHVQNVLFQQSFIEFCKHPIHTYDILTPVTGKQWKSSSETIEYQCILTFDTTNTTICSLDHQIQAQKHIPCYNMQQIWSQESIDDLKLQLNIPKALSMTLGVRKSVDTVQLAIDLWHCRQFITQ
jgi:hypothetical protein